MPKFIFVGASGAGPEPSWLDHDGSLNSALYELFDPAAWSIDTFHENASVYLDSDLNVLIIAIYDRLFLVGDDGSGGLEIKDYVELDYAYGIAMEASDPAHYPDHHDFSYSLGGAFAAKSDGSLYFTNVYKFRSYSSTFPYFYGYAYFDQLPVNYTSTAISIGTPIEWYQQSTNDWDPLSLHQMYLQYLSDDLVYFEYEGGTPGIDSYVFGDIFINDPFGSSPSHGTPYVPVASILDGTSGQYSRISDRQLCTNTGAPPPTLVNLWNKNCIDIDEGDWKYAAIWTNGVSSSNLYTVHICVGKIVTTHPSYPGVPKFYSAAAFSLTAYFGGNSAKKHMQFILKQIEPGYYFISNGQYNIVLALNYITGEFTHVADWIGTFALYCPTYWDDQSRIEWKADISLPCGESWISKLAGGVYVWSMIPKVNAAGFVDDVINIQEYYNNPAVISFENIPIRWASYRESLDEIWTLMVDDITGKIYGQRTVR